MFLKQNLDIFGICQNLIKHLIYLLIWFASFKISNYSFEEVLFPVKFLFEIFFFFNQSTTLFETKQNKNKTKLRTTIFFSLDIHDCFLYHVKKQCKQVIPGNRFGSKTAWAQA